MALDPLAPKPVLAAIPCPDDKIPQNCRKAIRICEANGLAWSCTYAIGPEPDRIESVLLQVGIDGRSKRAWARWETGKAGSKTADKFGFYCAFATTPLGGWPLGLTFGEFVDVLQAAGNQPAAAGVQSL